MKKALFIGSLYCTFLGVLALISAFLLNDKIMAILILLLAYFVGTPLLFAKQLPYDEKLKIMEQRLKFTYGKKFWLPILSFIFISFLVSFACYYFLGLDISASILIFLGFSAILTAFISPSVESMELAEIFD